LTPNISIWQTVVTYSSYRKPMIS